MEKSLKELSSSRVLKSIFFPPENVSCSTCQPQLDGLLITAPCLCL